MMHRWEGDGHAHPDVEVDPDPDHDDDHWTIMDTFKLEKLFHSMDEDGDGQVSKAEWEKAFKEFGTELRHTFGHTVDDIEKLFTTIDTDGSGTLSMDEFLEAAPKMKEESS
jgi:Ca2+-binding EF-hand superfamily protein